jgi:hypothetical protein
MSRQSDLFLDEAVSKGLLVDLYEVKDDKRTILPYLKPSFDYLKGLGWKVNSSSWGGRPDATKGKWRIRFDWDLVVHSTTEHKPKEDTFRINCIIEDSGKGALKEIDNISFTQEDLLSAVKKIVSFIDSYVEKAEKKKSEESYTPIEDKYMKKSSYGLQNYESVAKRLVKDFGDMKKVKAFIRKALSSQKSVDDPDFSDAMHDIEDYINDYWDERKKKFRSDYDED